METYQASRWKKLYEQSHALVQKLSGEAGELMDERAEVLVKYKSLVEDSFAAVKEGHEVTKKEIEDVLAHQPIKNVAGVWAESLERVSSLRWGMCPFVLP